MDNTYIYHYSSPIGNIILSSEGKMLTGLWFEEQYSMKGCIRRNLPVFKETAYWLDIYFDAKAPSFTPPLLMQATPFRKAVWEIMLTIPFGKTMTYGEIASKIAKQNGIERMCAQAVGGAAGHNPISLIVPCHRVVGANGSLTGYTGGIDKKLYLLRLEGVDVTLHN